MTHNTLIVSNWKMNLNFLDAKKLLKNICKIKFDTTKTLHVICPQNLLLPLLNEKFKDGNYKIGSQDFHHKINGPFTGDTSIELLKNFRCDYSIIGHSERREYHAETNKIINQKLKLALENSVSPILCVGESLKQRKEKTYSEFIENQIQECVDGNMNELVIAYEPIWSIGTGIIPSLGEIEEVINKINLFVQRKKVKKFKVIYGGSVSANNFKKIMSLKNCKGVLIGGSSLKIDQMNKILTFC